MDCPNGAKAKNVKYSGDRDLDEQWWNKPGRDYACIRDRRQVHSLPQASGVVVPTVLTSL